MSDGGFSYNFVKELVSGRGESISCASSTTVKIK